MLIDVEKPIRKIDKYDVQQLCKIYGNTLGSDIRPSEYNKSYYDYITQQFSKIDTDIISLSDFLNTIARFFEKGTYYFLRVEHLESNCFKDVSKEDIWRFKEYFKFRFYMGCNFNFTIAGDFKKVKYKNALLMQNLSSIPFKDVPIKETLGFLIENNIPVRSYEFTLNFSSNTNLDTFLNKIVNENKVRIYDEISDLLARNYQAITDFHTNSILNFINSTREYAKELSFVE
ncbi:hypothetical protein [Priestia megaterium]|uniref:Uncharacterized protein n=1 Tax=Priestia megaterium TaxID=1404 RepID=A0A6M6E8Z9_PRIMG|nr:hypothetical protein [Priestia megaterium]QJX80898.1 hypothetical protein FDZ14_32935 [Priestia megaterium]